MTWGGGSCDFAWMEPPSTSRAGVDSPAWRSFSGDVFYLTLVFVFWPVGVNAAFHGLELGMQIACMREICFVFVNVSGCVDSDVKA